MIHVNFLKGLSLSLFVRYFFLLLRKSLNLCCSGNDDANSEKDVHDSPNKVHEAMSSNIALAAKIGNNIN